MAKGKHGISAAARQAVGERDQSIAAYQHNIRKLTAENAELKQKLADQQASHSRTVRVLKAERDEAASPQVKAMHSKVVDLEALVRRLKDNLQKAEIAYKATGDALTKAYTAAGLGVAEARERTLNEGIYLIDGGNAIQPGDENVVTFGTDGVRHKGTGRVLTESQKAIVRQVQRAKGLRK